MRLAFFDTKPYDREVFEPLLKASGIETIFYDTRICQDDCILASGCDAVCVFVNDEVDRKVIDTLAEYKVKVIALRCAGFNNVDYKYANSKGIKVVRVPAYSPYAVAEHAMALLQTLNRKIHKAYIRTRDFNFSLNGLTGFDLHGKTVGVIGTGKIGRVFIDICKGYGMKVLAYDKFPAEGSDINYTSLEEIYKEADIISFHCPLTEETLHMFNRGTINRVKDGVVIINTSRGALIDAEALLLGIRSRKIGGACLDVYEEEAEYFYEDRSGNIIDDDTLSRLISMPNVIVTSHQAFLTKEALGNIAATTVENLLAIASGKESANEVV
ncbi:MAG: 2-hydroxyacid dehydrogenase [Saccharofermentans sp.]|nr:2-hydroxyacid dehydrogenase [Saccharofermentans sp.]